MSREGLTVARVFVPANVCIRAAEEYCGLPEDALVAQVRTAELVRARIIAMSIYDELNIVSLSMIGRAFRRDHTSVMHALSRADKYRAEIDELRTAVVQAVRSGERYKPPQEEVEPPPVEEPPCEWPLPRVVEEDRRASVFVPRKVKPRVAAVSRRPAVMTGYLMGDPGGPSARVDRGEASKGAW